MRKNSRLLHVLMFLAICLTRLGRSDTLPQQYTLSMEIPVVAQPETVPIVNAVPITDTPQPVIPIYGIYAYPASVATVVPLAIGETQPGTISDTSQSIQWNPMAATTTTNLLGTGQSNPIAPTAKSANENPIIQSQPVESNTNIVPVAQSTSSTSITPAIPIITIGNSGITSMTITNTAQNTGGIVTGNNADTTLRPNTPAIPIGSEQPVPPTPGTDNPVPNGSTVSPTQPDTKPKDQKKKIEAEHVKTFAQKIGVETLEAVVGTAVFVAGIEGARHVYKNHKKAKKRLNKNHPPQTPAQSSITDLHDKHLKEKEALQQKHRQQKKALKRKNKKTLLAKAHRRQQIMLQQKHKKEQEDHEKEHGDSGSKGKRPRKDKVNDNGKDPHVVPGHRPPPFNSEDFHEPGPSQPISHQQDPNHPHTSHSSNTPSPAQHSQQLSTAYHQTPPYPTYYPSNLYPSFQSTDSSHISSHIPPRDPGKISNN